MKKLIAVILALCLMSAVFVACARQNDRAKNNGIVTDDTTGYTDTTDNRTTDKATGKSRSIIDDAGDAVSDAVRGVTDAVDDMLGGGTSQRMN